MKMPMHFPSLALAFAVAGITTLIVTRAFCQPDKVSQNPVEVGKVMWIRDYDEAVAAGKKSGKPLFVLFQEVPGCSGCQQFGRAVLSDAKVVKAIEENFTPLLIHNNKGGKDAEVLKKFEEPAWNYQVVRFLNAQGKDLIPRKDRVWEASELLERMKLALEKAGRPAMKTTSINRVAISQYCFWTGEMKLGAMDGVTCTEAGFLNGSEVTLVDYDPAKISLAELTRKATEAGVASKVFTQWKDGYEKAPLSDQKRQLQGTKYAKMELTPEQATKVNAFARSDPKRADEFLTKK